MTCLIRECTKHPHAPMSDQPLVRMESGQMDEAVRNQKLAQNLVYFWVQQLEERPLADIAAI